MNADLSLKLRSASSPQWLKTCLEYFDDFLIDHAASERKASATGIQFVVRYPDKTSLHQMMIRMAQEELSHFRDVMRLIEARGLVLKPDLQTPYIHRLLKEIRQGRELEFLDRLLVFGIVEARGCERFGLIGEALQDNTEQSALKRFYMRLARAEAKHHRLFLRAASQFFETGVIKKRLDHLLDIEGQLLTEMPLRAAVH